MNRYVISIIKNLLILILILFSSQAFAQKCDCDLYYKWLKSTFERNDAGFKYILESKGQERYDRHNENISRKVSQETDLNKCTIILKEWLTFFRKFHIGLYPNAPDVKNRLTVSMDLKPKKSNEIDKLIKSMQNKLPSSIEGIWKTNNYEILINQERKNYVGYIVQSANQSWKKGDVKFTFSSNLGSGVYWAGDHSADTISKISFSGNKYLTLDDLTLEKATPFIKLEPQQAFKYKVKFATEPFIERLDEKTLYIKIPSFGLDQKAILDSLTNHWKSELTTTKNLIIDVRGNGGGADKTYNKLLPFTYTNPIHRNQLEFYSSEMNNKNWIELSKNKNLSTKEKLLFTDFANRLQANIGGFERIFKEDISIIKLDSVYRNPEKIAVITDKHTASAAEQFILDLKQSWKVKTFGNQTAGALDVANISTTESPDKKLTLVYSTSRFITIGKLVIDDVGILPDYYIDDKISEEAWVKFILDRMH
ncbi:S41 family peptidase [Pedobacter nototheniae]|uniref:S41 family peptidase n=1 Tax=Pedobacter nototheniae TaxID=2488994 RepID=UPI0029316536|nr:S41 family peptidase [Pedobacter nototheniae]